MWAIGASSYWKEGQSQARKTPKRQTSSQMTMSVYVSNNVMNCRNGTQLRTGRNYLHGSKVIFCSQKKRTAVKTLECGQQNPPDPLSSSTTAKTHSGNAMRKLRPWQGTSSLRMSESEGEQGGVSPRRFGDCNDFLGLVAVWRMNVSAGLCYGSQSKDDSRPVQKPFSKFLCISRMAIVSARSIRLRCMVHFRGRGLSWTT